MFNKECNMSQTPSLSVRFLEDSDHKQNIVKTMQHIKKVDAESRALYTPSELAEAEALFRQAQSTFMRSRVFINHRPTFIAIKIEKVAAADRLTEAYDAFERAMADKHAGLDHKNGHHIYHIFPR
jgi:hypothetical protein